MASCRISTEVFEQQLRTTVLRVWEQVKLRLSRHVAQQQARAYRNRIYVVIYKIRIFVAQTVAGLIQIMRKTILRIL